MHGLMQIQLGWKKWLLPNGIRYFRPLRPMRQIKLLRVLQRICILALPRYKTWSTIWSPPIATAGYSIERGYIFIVPKSMQQTYVERHFFRFLKDCGYMHLFNCRRRRLQYGMHVLYSSLRRQLLHHTTKKAVNYGGVYSSFFNFVTCTPVIWVKSLD